MSTDRTSRTVMCPICGRVRTIKAYPREFIAPSRKCHSCAAKAALVGPFGPLADEVVVYRLMDGQLPVVSNIHERTAAVHLLRHRGLTQRAIADRTGLSERTVQRLLRPAA